MKARTLQQLLTISALGIFGTSSALADPSYTLFEFGERYDKASRQVEPGFAVKSLTRTPPVNTDGAEKGTSRKSASQARKDLKPFEPAAAGQSRSKSD
ncbi:MAG: hypothetical protein ACI8UO_000260 [Verrucomicrobiales bacterium]|jgi:hypothetical protein